MQAKIPAQWNQGKQPLHFKNQKREGSKSSPFETVWKINTKDRNDVLVSIDTEMWVEMCISTKLEREKQRKKRICTNRSYEMLAKKEKSWSQRSNL